MERVLLAQESRFYLLDEVAFEWGLRMNGFGHCKKKGRGPRDSCKMKGTI